MRYSANNQKEKKRKKIHRSNGWHIAGRFRNVAQLASLFTNNSRLTRDCAQMKYSVFLIFMVHLSRHLFSLSVTVLDMFCKRYGTKFNKVFFLVYQRCYCFSFSKLWRWVCVWLKWIIFFFTYLCHSVRSNPIW